MTRCFVCQKKIDDNEDDVCDSCKDFFKGKYGEDYPKYIMQFISLLLESTSKSTKFCRRYKNG
jgi:hypothetical protein